PGRRGDRGARLPGPGQLRGFSGRRLVLLRGLCGRRRRAGGCTEPDGAPGQGAHAHAGDPLRAGLALPGGAGAALVRGTEAAWGAGRAAAVPGRGARAEPVGHTEAPDRPIRAHPRLVAAAPAGELSRSAFVGRGCRSAGGAGGSWARGGLVALQLGPEPGGEGIDPVVEDRDAIVQASEVGLEVRACR